MSERTIPISGTKGIPFTLESEGRRPLIATNPFQSDRMIGLILPDHTYIGVINSVENWRDWPYLTHFLTQGMSCSVVTDLTSPSVITPGFLANIFLAYVNPMAKKIQPDLEEILLYLNRNLGWRLELEVIGLIDQANPGFMKKVNR